MRTNKESIDDLYQVMKFAGDEIDLLHDKSLNIKDHENYWDLMDLWWNAGSVYANEMIQINNGTRRDN